MWSIFKKYNAELKLIWSIRYFNSGDVITAVKLSKESLRIFPEYFDALMFLGDIYGSIKDYHNALKYYKLAIGLDNSDVVAYVSAINCLSELDMDNEALSLSKKGLTLYKDNFNLLLCRVYIFEKIEEYDKELECADYILNLGKNKEEALFIKATVYDLQKKYECSFKCYEDIAKIDKRNIDAWYGLVLSSYNLENFNNASKFAEKVISLDNKNPYMYCLLASFLEKLGKYEKALENIDIAIELEDNHSYYYLKGLILGEMGEEKQSQEFYRIGVELALDSLDSDSSANSYAFIGAFFERLGEYNKAEEYFNKSGKTSSEMEDIYLN